MDRRLSKSGSGGMVQLVNKGETSPCLLINPVFTITANNWASACDQAASRRCFPKQKSKSSGASPQKYPSNGCGGGGGSGHNFAEEFINIITSSDSIDYCAADYDYDEYGPGAGAYGRNNGHHHHRSFHSNPYLNYGSNSRLLQVPSASTLLFPRDDLSPERAAAAGARQQRSSSITVPIGHVTRSPERSFGGGNMRRCSSASPKGRYHQYQQQMMNLSPQLTPTLHPFEGGRRNSCATTTTANGTNTSSRRRRRSSTYSARSRRLSTQNAVWSSSSSISSGGDGGGDEIRHPSTKRSPSLRRPSKVTNKENNHRARERTLSMPTSELILLSSTTNMSNNLGGGVMTSSSSPSEGGGSADGMKKKKKVFYDTVIIGSPAVGKSTLAEYFNNSMGRKGGSGSGSSGSDQGIGSDEDSSSTTTTEDSSYDDQDLSAGGKAIVFRPHPQQHQYTFSLRIFSQQISAVNHLYKYDAVIILYSVTDRDSFEFARKALAEINSHLLQRPSQQPPQGKVMKSGAGNRGHGTTNTPNPKKVVILVANKSDLERSRLVTPLEGRSLATAYNCKFIEISSSLGVGIDALQKGLATQVYLRHHKALINKSPTLDNGDMSKSSTTTCSSPCSSTSTSSSNNSSSFLLLEKKRWGGGGGGKGRNNGATTGGLKNPALTSLKMAQKLIERIMSLRFSPQNSKSCLDLHTL